MPRTEWGRVCPHLTHAANRGARDNKGTGHANCVPLPFAQPCYVCMQMGEGDDGRWVEGDERPHCFSRETCCLRVVFFPFICFIMLSYLPNKKYDTREARMTRSGPWERRGKPRAYETRDEGRQTKAARWCLPVRRALPCLGAIARALAAPERGKHEP